jgi:hypothetical protein
MSTIERFCLKQSMGFCLFMVVEGGPIRLVHYFVRKNPRTKYFVPKARQDCWKNANLGNQSETASVMETEDVLHWEVLVPRWNRRRPTLRGPGAKMKQKTSYTERSWCQDERRRALWRRPTLRGPGAKMKDEEHCAQRCWCQFWICFCRSGDEAFFL